ncbi:MAG: TonB family protein [Deltaproteobacteria bacterium]|nr:TonB family protein [Deltaproteobacteria bacterium]
MKWHSMLGLSIIFHLGIFSFFLFVPEAMPTRRFDSVIYSVDLVEMPERNVLELRQAKIPTEEKKKTEVKRDEQAKRISKSKEEKKPLVVAKRTVEVKRPSTKKPETSPADRIDHAISRIENEVKSKEESEKEDEARLERTLASLESRFGGSTIRDGTGQSVEGIPMQIYRMEVEERIYSNWAYPERKELKAIIVLTVRRDGTILENKIRKRSGDSLFDESALKAIKRSDPLPPFPEIYKKSYAEIEIIFNPQNL